MKMIDPYKEWNQNANEDECSYNELKWNSDSSENHSIKLNSQI